MLLIVAAVFLLNEVSASIHPHDNDPSINNNTNICGSQLHFTSMTGIIQTPGYPIRYPGNVFCTYAINVTEGLRIELRWKDFDVDGNMPDCASEDDDYVEIFTGCGYNRQYLTRFCSRNSVQPHALYSTDNCMTVNFFSRLQSLPKISKGFLAEYKAVNRSSTLSHQNCNRTIRESAGIMHSSFWPRTYSHVAYDNCNWHLKMDQPMAIKLTIMDLDTYSSYGLCNQCLRNSGDIFVQGIGSLYASKQSWVTFCGQCRPFTYQASYNELIINWRLASSPYSYEDSHGFILGYVAYQPVVSSVAAEWQYILLIATIAPTFLIIILFACHSSGFKGLFRHRKYQRFENADTRTVNERDVQASENPIAQEDERSINAEDTEAERQAINITIDATISDNDDNNSTHSQISLSEPGLQELMDFASIYTPRNPVQQNNQLIEVLYHPAPPSLQPSIPAQNIETQSSFGVPPYQNEMPFLQEITPDNFSKHAMEVPQQSSVSLVPDERPELQGDIVIGATCPESAPEQPSEETSGAKFHDNMAGEEEKGPIQYIDNNAMNNAARGNSEDSVYGSNATAPLAPPAYSEIFDELQSLSRIISEIISDVD